MDIATIIGIIGGIALIAGSIAMGSPLSTFFNLPGLLIVLGGTIMATLIMQRLHVVLGAVKVAMNAFVDGDFVYVADGNGDLQILRAFAPCTEINVAPGGATLSAQVPSGLLPGAYNLHVVNPGGEAALLHNGFAVTAGRSLPLGVMLLLLSDN